jgi:phosphate starvation-inducible protein PhoH and related proteins
VTKRAKRAEIQNNRAERLKTNRSHNGGSHTNQNTRPGYDDFQDLPERFTQKKKRVDLIPRSLTQEKYVKTLEDDNKHIVFATGPAGTGKTLLGTLYAIKGLKEGKFDKIIITRPAVSVDEEHGFLPGTLIEKMAPWVIPITDIIKEYYTPAQLEFMLQNEIIEIAPLAYMRGRTLKNACILFDEAQNATPSQMKMVLSRISEGSKMIITGDVSQHDRGYEENGLKDFMERLYKAGGSDQIGLISFDATEIERHPVIEEILELYGDVK